MKKQMYYLFAALLLIGFAACNQNPPTPPQPEEPAIDDPTVESNMQLRLNGLGIISSDTTITLHDGTYNYLTGKLTMEVKGSISGVEKVRVVVTRSATGREDELCALGVCSAGNGEKEQVFDFTVVDGQSAWYAHYTVPENESEPYTVNYKFINYSHVVNLKVVYDYQQSE